MVETHEDVIEARFERLRDLGCVASQAITSHHLAQIGEGYDEDVSGVSERIHGDRESRPGPNLLDSPVVVARRDGIEHRRGVLEDQVALSSRLL